MRMEAKPSLLSPLRMEEPPQCVEVLVMLSAYSSLPVLIILLSAMLTRVSSLPCSAFKSVCC